MNTPNKDQDPIGAFLFAARDSAGTATQDDPDAEEAETPDLNNEESANEDKDALNPSADQEQEADETNTQTTNRNNKETKGVGYDKMLEAIQEKFGDDGVKSFKAMQARTTRAEQKFSEMEKLAQETRELLETLEEKTDKDKPEEEPEEQLDEFEAVMSKIKDPNQRALFSEALEAWKKSQGIVTRSDQAKEKKEQEISQFTTEATKRGVELFGEEFGTLDGDKFIPNAKYVEKAQPVLNRLSGDGVLTHEDLYWIAMGPEIKKKAFEEGRAAAMDEANKKQNTRTAQARKLNGVATKPSGGSSDLPLYDREDKKQTGDIRSYIKRFQERLDKVGKMPV